MPTVKSCIYARFLSHAEKSCGGGEGVLIFFFAGQELEMFQKSEGLKRKGWEKMEVGF